MILFVSNICLQKSPPLPPRVALFSVMVMEKFRFGNSASLNCSYFYDILETSYMVLNV